MGQPKELDDKLSNENLTVDAADAAQTATGRRHRFDPKASDEARFPEREAPIGFTPTNSLGVVSDELRAMLWDVIYSFLFAPEESVPSRSFESRGERSSRWSQGDFNGRVEVRRVWAAPPISGDPQRMPEDIVSLLEGWFSLVEPGDVFAFVESVHDSVDTPNQPRFASMCNGALERGCADRRFVARRLMPISSRTDITTVERALHACKPAHMVDVETHLLDALDRFAQKTDPDFKGAVEEAIRAVEEATFVLTGERPPSLDDALVDLELKGYVDSAMKAAYGGLSSYVSTLGFNAQTSSGFIRRTTQDDARLIVVMCAGFLIHLAAKM